MTRAPERMAGTAVDEYHGSYDMCYRQHYRYGKQDAATIGFVGFKLDTTKDAIIRVVIDGKPSRGIFLMKREVADQITTERSAVCGMSYGLICNFGMRTLKLQRTPSESDQSTVDSHGNRIEFVAEYFSETPGQHVRTYKREDVTSVLDPELTEQINNKNEDLMDAAILVLLNLSHQERGMNQLGQKVDDMHICQASGKEVKQME